VSDPAVRALVQARMGSRRFPGKVLAPFHREPLVLHVIRAVGEAVGREAVVVATSIEPADDPLVAYVDSIGIPSFRGPLDDVLERFRLCARRFPSEWILRISADSPLLDPAELRAVIDAAEDGLDLVTTALSENVPHGRNAELILARTLLALDDQELTPHDREHVTPFFYRHADRFAIRNVTPPPRADGSPLTIDTVEDLRRLEALR
jgi:spore coat polysaccharide biosynthesis protein SpsF